MFGGIAATGADRLVYATFDGHVLQLDATGAVTGQFTVFPCGPRRVHLSACAAGPDGALYLGDTVNRRVRRFDARGLQTGLVGTQPVPGIEEPDQPGVLTEPCALLARPDRGLYAASGGLGARHGVQFFRGGGYERSLAPPAGAWRRAQGLAWVHDALWVAETEAGALWRFAPDAVPVELHPDLRQPFRLASDGFDGVLLLMLPDEDEAYGVARLDRDGGFEGWAVKPGENPGQVYLPFDLTVLPDGRFVVADFPLGGPPEVRLQLFAADGRHLAVLLDGTDDLRAAQERWFRAVLDDAAAPAYEKARAHHFYSAGARLDEARALYGEAAAAEPESSVLAHLGLATLLHHSFHDLPAAEAAYARALEAGGPRGEMQARIGECRRERGDFDGAIAILREAVEGDDPPEDLPRRIEELGSCYLERAGESSET